MMRKRKQTAFERRIMGFVAIGRFKVADAADALGVSHTTLGRRCRALGIDPVTAHADYVRRNAKILLADCGVERDVDLGPMPVPFKVGEPPMSTIADA
jgi:hypothetical protein